MGSSKSPQRIAFSYLRYSDPKQGDGDSIRRQTAKAREWCERNGVTLDIGRYCDPGVSAFRGKHRETGVLAAFLRDVEEERIPRGSILLIENMDRLSREPPVRGVHLLAGILLAGISVVTLAPEELELTEDSDLFSLFRGQMSQARGHDESKTKSSRVTEAWDQRKRLARAGKGIVTRKLPAWVREQEGKLVAIPERAAIVKQIFDLAAKGRGLSMILRQLETDQVQPWGHAQANRGKAEAVEPKDEKACWRRAYLHKILHSRAVLGEYQPMKGRRADGNAILNYFPKVIEIGLWERVQDALSARTKRAGRIGVKVANLFSGLLWDARTRDKMLIAWQNRGRPPTRQRYRVLVSADAVERGCGAKSFPNDVFEPALLQHLREIDPADITGEEPKSETATLAAEVAGIQDRMKVIEAELAGDTGNVPALARVLVQLDARHQAKLRELAAARRAEENPLSGTWAEARTLLELAQDEGTRLRLRSLLQTAITEIWVLVVRVEDHVLCWSQVHFRSGVFRDVLIDYRPATRGRSMSWDVISIAKQSGPGAGRDLRHPPAAAKLEKLLLKHSVGAASNKRR